MAEKRKYKFEFKYHITAVDKKLLKAVADMDTELEIGKTYGYSKKKRAHILAVGDGFVDVKIVNRRNDDYGRPSDDISLVKVTW